MTTLTLTRMAEGGLYDQLGGGFCRYSVDPYWMIPHFEKMLYDNGAAARRLRRSARSPPARAVPARGRRDRRLDAARHARSRRAASTRRSMPTRKATKASSTSGIATRCRTCSSRTSSPCSRRGSAWTATPNFEGRWHLHGFKAMAEVATELGLGRGRGRRPARHRRAPSCSIFATGGSGRPRREDHHQLERARDRGPGTASRALDVPQYAEAAVRAVRLPARARVVPGRGCWRCTRTGARASPPYLDDYAFLAWGLRSCCRRDGTPRHWRGPSSSPR